MVGTVASFDDHRGYGTIEAGSGIYFFHCTRIVDGTRTVDEGARVAFELVPGHRGRWEAAAVTPL